MTQSAPGALGRFIREQRQLAQLSLREMARLTSVSNAYLSQVERGLHQPSVRVLNALADVLEVPIETMVVQDGAQSGSSEGTLATVEASIRSDRRLTVEQKEALLAVYRSYVGESGAPKA